MSIKSNEDDFDSTQELTVYEFLPKERDTYDDSVSIYLAEISKPVLTKEEERELFIRFKSGDSNAREILIERNLRLVANIAKKYVGRGLSYLDLIQEGNIALMQAVDKFDLSRGLKFSTYASAYINGLIDRAIRNKARCVRLPSYLYEKIRDYRDAEKKLTNQFMRQPTLEELSEELKISLKEVTLLYEVQQDFFSFNILSSHNDDAELIDFLPDSCEEVDDIVVKKVLPDEIRDLFVKCNLKPVEIVILTLRYGLSGGEGISLEEIGQKLNLSRERIRQKEYKALMKLRKSAFIKEFAVYMDNPEGVLENIKAYIKKDYQTKLFKK